MDLENTPRAGLLIGHAAISAYLNIDPRQAAALVAEKAIPTFTVGGHVVARRDSLTPLRPPSAVPPALARPAWSEGEHRHELARQKQMIGRLDGLSEIAAFLNATHGQARAMIDAGMPCTPAPAGITATRSAIEAWIEQTEAKANG